MSLFSCCTLISVINIPVGVNNPILSPQDAFLNDNLVSSSVYPPNHPPAPLHDSVRKSPWPPFVNSPLACKSSYLSRASTRVRDTFTFRFTYHL